MKVILLIIVIVIVSVLIVAVGNKLRMPIASIMVGGPLALLIATAWAASPYGTDDRGIQRIGILLCVLAMAGFFWMAHAAPPIDVWLKVTQWRRQQARRAQVRRSIQQATPVQTGVKYRAEVKSV